MAFHSAARIVVIQRSNLRNAHDLIKLLRAAGQQVSPDLAKLDQGPVASSVSQRSKGGKGTKSGRGLLAAAEAAGPSNDTGVRIEGVQDDVQPITRFQDSPFRKAIRKELLAAGYTEPTPIQAYGWPLLLSGRDCIAIAKTGSGKTLAFLLPALHNIHSWLQEAGPGADGAGPLALVAVGFVLLLPSNVVKCFCACRHSFFAYIDYRHRCASPATCSSSQSLSGQSRTP
eukprot:s497_g19.t1